MKKLFISIIMLMLLVSIPASAANLLLMDMSSDYTWTTTERRGGAVSIDDGTATMSFDSDRGSSAGVTSPAFSFSGQYLKIEFTMTESAGSHASNEKLVELSVGSSKTELMKLVQGKLWVLGEAVMVEGAQYTLTPGTAHDITIYIGGGKLLMSDGTISVVKSFTAGASLKLGFTNDMTERDVQAASEFKVENVSCEQAPAISYITPADNRDLFRGEELTSFNIEHEGYLHESMYQVSNYEIYQNDVLLTQGVRAADDNGAIALSIEGGFIPGSYRIKMKSSKDIFEASAGSTVDVSFRVVSDDYDPEQNKIELALLSGEGLVEGQKALVSVSAVSQESPITKIELYIDNRLHETVYSAGFERELLLSSGEHEIYAVMVTEMGRIASNTVTADVLANAAPRVSFRDYSGTANLNVNTDRSITVLAEDTNGIDRVELYCAGVLLDTVTAAPYVFDISSVGLGEYSLKAVAYDTYGKSAQAVLAATISNSFESNKDDSPVENNSNITYDTNTKVGYARVEQIDGNSCIVLGRDAGVVVDGATDGAYFQYNFTSDKQKLGFVFEYDLKVLEKPESGSSNYFNMLLRYVDKSLDTFMNIQDEKITWRNNSTSGFSYDDDQWYRVVMTLDIEKGVFSARIKKDNVVVWSTQEEYNPSTLTTKNGFHCIRFVAPKNNNAEAQSSKIAIDNISVRSLMYAPTVLGCGDANNTSLDIIDNAAESVWVYLSGAINADDVTDEKITLYREGNIKCSAQVSWHSDKNAIEVKPLDGFLPNTGYSVKIAADVRMSDGITGLGGELLAEFETSTAIKINGVTFETAAEGLVARVDVSSQSGEEEWFWAVSSIWQGDTFVRTYAQLVTAGGADMPELVYTDNLMDKRVELYFLSSLNHPRMIANQIYTN